MSRLTSVHKFCVECQGGSKYFHECPSYCLLYPYREGKGGKVPAKSIKDYCLHCNGVPLKEGVYLKENKHKGADFRMLDRKVKSDWAKGEAKNCSDKNCHLYQYRYGTKNRG